MAKKQQSKNDWIEKFGKNDVVLENEVRTNRKALLKSSAIYQDLGVISNAVTSKENQKILIEDL